MLGSVPGVIAVFAVVVLVGWVLGLGRRRLKASSPGQQSTQQARAASETHPQPEKPPSSPSEDGELVIRLRRNLKLKLSGNDAAVDRLIEYERKKNPSGHLVEWMSTAIQRWEDDNRR